MIKISAAYNHINPNFVIQNMDEPKSWAHPIFAVLKNILMRGCPTLPSLSLRQKFGIIPQFKKFSYCRDFTALNWDGVIKGGDKSNPALEFYKHILPTIFPNAGTFIPECSVCDILSDVESKDLWQVDFYSPFYNIVIEIDGDQHKEAEQKARDLLRDDLFKRHGIDTVRIPVKQLTDCFALSQLFSNQIKKVSTDEKLATEDMPYLFAIRLQCALLYLYGNEKLTLDEEQLSVNLLTDFTTDEQTIRVIIDDFFSWLENLAALQNVRFVAPKIDVVLHKDIKSLCNGKGVKIDISLTKVYSVADYDDVLYIRNDYFTFSVYNQIRSNGQLLNFASKNYFRVAYSPIEYRLTEKLHSHNLLFILQNISVAEYSNFRANQLEIILEALNNRCVIGILPTGAGKSLCYQITALLIPAMTVVIAPLKLLMVDQHEHLYDKMGINQSTFINSSHTENISLFTSGKSLITLVAPERFFSEKFSSAFNNKKYGLNIGFIVIDEAHCLSEWGHDFRTSYLCLSHNLSLLLPSNTFLMALTGTASHSVFKDIENEFYYFKKKPTPAVFASDMRRPNLTVFIKKFSPNAQEDNDIAQELSDNIYPTIMGNNNKKTLVFTKTKYSRVNDKNASACITLSEKFAQLAEDNGHNGVVGCFASGDSMDDAQKDKVLSNFKNDSALRVLFATKAFGMGIDIPDIRKTIHYGLPSSIESLYQQIGRAGRDGKPSDCYIYFCEEKDTNYQFFFGKNRLKISEIVKNQNNLSELNTNFYFLQNANLDVEIEEEVVKRIYKGIELRNSKGCDYVDCATMSRAVYNVTKDSHLKDILGTQNNSIDEETGVKKEEFKVSQSAKIIIERALYRLYILGEIEMWNVVYSSDITNPMFTHLKKTQLTDKQKYERLVKHIERYESHARAMPKTADFDSRLKKLLSWSYDNFILERIKSMKTLYDWCMDFTSSADFMRHLSDYFSNDPVYVRLVDKNSTIDDLVLALHRDAQDTKLRIARLLEAYENIDLLNYLSGMVRLRLNEFDDFDGERRFDMSFVGIDLMSKQDRDRLFIESYECCDSKEMKNIFVGKWLQRYPKDVKQIYEKTQDEQAEKYLLADFAHKLLRIKEKIHARLQ